MGLRAPRFRAMPAAFGRRVRRPWGQKPKKDGRLGEADHPRMKHLLDQNL